MSSHKKISEELQDSWDRTVFIEEARERLGQIASFYNSPEHMELVSKYWDYLTSLPYEKLTSDHALWLTLVAKVVVLPNQESEENRDLWLFISEGVPKDFRYSGLRIE